MQSRVILSTLNNQLINNPVINIYNLFKLIHCFYKTKVLTVSVTAVAGGRPRFFAGSLVTGVEGVLGVDSGPGAGVAGPV